MSSTNETITIDNEIITPVTDSEPEIIKISDCINSTIEDIIETKIEREQYTYKDAKRKTSVFKLNLILSQSQKETKDSNPIIFGPFSLIPINSDETYKEKCETYDHKHWLQINIGKICVSDKQFDLFNAIKNDKEVRPPPPPTTKPPPPTTKPPPPTTPPPPPTTPPPPPPPPVLDDYIEIVKRHLDPKLRFITPDTSKILTIPEYLAEREKYVAGLPDEEVNNNTEVIDEESSEDDDDDNDDDDDDEDTVNTPASVRLNKASELRKEHNKKKIEELEKALGGRRRANRKKTIRTTITTRHSRTKKSKKYKNQSRKRIRRVTHKSTMRKKKVHSRRRR